MTNKTFPRMKPASKKTFILSYQELCFEHINFSMVLGVVKNYVLSALNLINNSSLIKLKVRYIHSLISETFTFTVNARGLCTFLVSDEEVPNTS